MNSVGCASENGQIMARRQADTIIAINMKR